MSICLCPRRNGRPDRRLRFRQIYFIAPCFRPDDCRCYGKSRQGRRQDSAKQRNNRAGHTCGARQGRFRIPAIQSGWPPAGADQCAVRRIVAHAVVAQLLEALHQEEKALGLEALARVGIAEHAYKRASTLSGGQQQRAAIARTIVQKARIVLADEPIASLDPESARRVMQTLADLNRQDGTTVVVSLHQVDLALRFCTAHGCA